MSNSKTSGFGRNAIFGSLAILLSVGGIGIVLVGQTNHKNSAHSTGRTEPELPTDDSADVKVTELTPGDADHTPTRSDPSIPGIGVPKAASTPSGTQTTGASQPPGTPWSQFASATDKPAPNQPTGSAPTKERPPSSEAAPAPNPNPTAASNASEFPVANRPVVAAVPRGPKPVLLARPLAVPHLVRITQIEVNDDSAKISWEPVPTAKDYRVINLSSPFRPKYAGGPTNTTVEMNGLDPVKASRLVVEAVDAVGPYQDIDPYAQIDDSMEIVLNGHGDPKNQPKAIGTSNVLDVICHPRTLTGEQTFFDRFQSNKPLVEKTAKDLDRELATLHTFSSEVCYQAYSNDKWDILLFDHQPEKTRLFFKDEQFRDILYDYHRTVRAKTVMVPKQTLTVPVGKVLHVTMEVDAYLSLNRSLGILVLPASDKITYPPAGGPHTQAGNIFDWQIASYAHDVQIFTERVARGANKSPDSKYNPARWTQQANSGLMGGGLNGGEEDLNRRHRFDLYLSANRYVIEEEGKVVNDVPLSRMNSVQPGNVYHDALPWFNTKPIKVAFYHYLHHSTADEIYLKRGEIAPRPAYWLDHRPDSDERHWDNMGFEVLDHFPSS